MATEESETKTVTTDTSLPSTVIAGQKHGSLALTEVDGRYDTVSWMERLDNHISEKFPLLDGMIRNAEMPVEPPLERDEEMLTEQADPHGINRQIMYEEAKMRTRNIQQRKLDSKRAYAIIEATILGTPLKAKCEREETWDEIPTTRDPLRLALMIERVAEVGGETNTNERKTILREQYSNIRMRPNEFLFEHYRRYMALVRRMRADGIRYHQEEMAYHFIQSLDHDRFKEYQRMCANISRGVQEGTDSTDHY